MSGISTNGVPNFTALNGSEQWVVDTQNAAGVNPESGSVSTNTLATYLNKVPNRSTMYRNLIDGGDFTVNPFQRGTSFATISNTVTYTADRFFAFGGSASQSMSVSSQAVSTVAGFTGGLNVGRTSATSNTASINIAQAFETYDTIRLQGQQITLSFWATAGSQFTAANSALTVQLISGQGTNQTAASMAAGTWTSQSSFLSQSQVISTTATRYEFTGTVPAATTQLGVQIGFVPVGSAVALQDFFQLQGVQLEVTQGTAAANGVTVAGATTGINATGSLAGVFEHRDIACELELCQRYAWQFAEPASGVIVATGQNVSTTQAQFLISTPVQMRTAPTVTATLGAFKVQSSAGVSIAVGTIAALASGHSTNGIGILYTSTGLGVGFANQLIGSNGAGSILASSDL